MRKPFALVVVIVMCLIVSAPLRAQDAPVRRITAETSDGLIFRIGLKNRTLTIGQDISIQIETVNNSNETIYIVQKQGPAEVAVEGRSLIIEPPLPVPVGHGGYDYVFVAVKPGESRSSQVVITADEYKSSEASIIKVGLGYVSDITGLDRRLGPTEDPAALRGLLLSRMETLQLGALVVLVTDR